MTKTKEKIKTVQFIFPVQNPFCIIAGLRSILGIRALQEAGYKGKLLNLLDGPCYGLILHEAMRALVLALHYSYNKPNKYAYI
jgi:hypothetical protein